MCFLSTVPRGNPVIEGFIIFIDRAVAWLDDRETGCRQDER